MHVDLRNASLDEFVAFVFDHPPAAAGAEEWYFDNDLEVSVEPTRQIAHLTRLLQGAGSLRVRFTPAQLEQGFWFMFGPGGEAYFVRALVDEGVDWASRRACLESIYNAYAGLFLVEPLEEAPYMLWDLLLHQWSDPAETIPDRMAQTMFATLIRILALPSETCQRGALHGLGHLRYPGTAKAVADFLMANPALGGDLREYALRVRDGQAVQ